MHTRREITVAGGGLPRLDMTWSVHGTTISYGFDAVQRDLAEVLAEAGCDESAAEAKGLLTFGHYDIDGGARPWLTIRQSDGSVFAFDEECDRRLRPLNSSLQAFVDTFCFLDSILHDGQPVPTDLAARLRALDPPAFDDSEWRGFADYILDD